MLRNLPIGLATGWQAAGGTRSEGSFGWFRPMKRLTFAAA